MKYLVHISSNIVKHLGAGDEWKIDCRLEKVSLPNRHRKNVPKMGTLVTLKENVIVHNNTFKTEDLIKANILVLNLFKQVKEKCDIDVLEIWNILTFWLLF